MNAYDMMAIVFGPCPHCSATAGEECVNQSGRHSRSTHWRRKLAVQEWKKADHQKLYREFRRAAIEILDRKQKPEYGLSGC